MEGSRAEGSWPSFDHRATVRISALAISHRQTIRRTLAGVARIEAKGPEHDTLIDTLILVVEDLRSDVEVEWALAESQRSNASTVVLVTDGAPDNLLHLNRIPYHGAITFDMVESHLVRAVQRVVAPDHLESVARSLDVAGSVDAVVRQALQASLRARPPLSTVNSWVRRLPCELSSFSEHWRVSRIPVRPYDWLRLVTLMRAHEVWRPSERLSEVESHTGWSRSRLRAASKGLFGRSLEDLLNDTELLESALIDAVTPIFAASSDPPR